MKLPVAILAGGLATRLGGVTERVPKALLEVAGQPFVVHQIELLAQHGLTELVLLVGHLGEMVRDAIGDGSRWGVRVRYAFDGPTRLGTGGAIRNALPALGDAFFVLYGDSYLECDYGAVERAFVASGKPALMTVCRNDDRWDRSNVWFEDGTIRLYDKGCRRPEMRHIDYGLGMLTRAALDGRPPGEAFDLASVYQALIARGELAGVEVGGRFYEIGSTRGLEEAREHLARRGQR